MVQVVKSEKVIFSQQTPETLFGFFNTLHVSGSLFFRLPVRNKGLQHRH